MSALCLAGGGAMARLALSAFTLMWTHTVEKTTWAEDWRVQGGQLQIVEARVQGSGAGMEPPPEAVLRDGAWRWKPQVPPLPEVILRRAPEAGDWRLCVDRRCQAFAEFLPGSADPVRIWACE